MDTIQTNTQNFKETEEELSSVVKRLGNPVSDSLAEFPLLYFYTSLSIDGLIGYQLVDNCAVVMGDPVCLQKHISALTQAFHLFCKKQNWTIVYFLASESFANWAIKNRCRTLIQVSEQLVVNPMFFKIKQKLRWKINQSLNRGVVVEEYQNSDPVFENKMEKAIDTWLKEKKRSQIYLGEINPFPKNDNDRIFYAIQEEKVVGLITLSHLDKLKGWVVTSFFAVPDAPVGVTEQLMSTVFDTLAKENCHFICLGVVSGSKLGKILGLNAFTKTVARLIFGISKWFFQFDTRMTYFNKFHPSYRPMYLLFSDGLSLQALLALKKVVKHPVK